MLAQTKCHVVGASDSHHAVCTLVALKLAFGPATVPLRYTVHLVNGLPHPGHVEELGSIASSPDRT